MTATTNERVERFKTEAAELNLKAGSASRDTLLQGAGAIAALVGIVIAFLAYQTSKGASDPRDVTSYISLAVGGLAVTVAGSVLFLRYSLAKFLRIWLLRQMYEGQAHIDQVVEAVKQR
jgi:ABC-type Fe3+ transport system permease subunit